jgi:hypothetical protein
VIDESTLDAEDKAELAALKGAKITLRQAIASAEKANGGRALNAGLEQGVGALYGKFTFKMQNIINRFASTRSPARFCNGGCSYVPGTDLWLRICSIEHNSAMAQQIVFLSVRRSSAHRFCIFGNGRALTTPLHVGDGRS